MRRRDQWMRWMKAIEREAAVVAFALEVLQERLQADPSLLAARSLGMAHFRQCVASRELTYLVRLCAVFESGLREAWSRAFHETTQPRLSDLLQAFASRRRIPPEPLATAHRLRNYRNRIVHDQSAGDADPITLELAQRFACRFFSHLPDDW
jgi:hypothetical protein